jgi:hypothetical protein
VAQSPTGKQSLHAQGAIVSTVSSIMNEVIVAKKGPKNMTDDHKAALAAGRAQGRAIGDYLDAVAAHKPKRGRQRTQETVQRQMQETNAALRTATGTARVELVQQKRNLEVELAGMQAQIDLTALETAFVQHASAYAERKQISYAAFREVGVPPEVLDRAGIKK